MDNDEKLITTHLTVETNDERIIVKDKLSKELKVLRYEDIFAILSFGNYVKVITENQIYICLSSMKRAETIFCLNDRFIRISRTTIISKNKLVSIQVNSVTLSNGTKYAIGRRFRKDFFGKIKKKFF